MRGPVSLNLSLTGDLDTSEAQLKLLLFALDLGNISVTLRQVELDALEAGNDGVKALLILHVVDFTVAVRIEVLSELARKFRLLHVLLRLLGHDGSDLLIEHSDLFLDHKQLELLHEATTDNTIFVTIVNVLTLGLLIHVLLLHLLDIILKYLHLIDTVTVEVRHLVNEVSMLLELAVRQILLGLVDLLELLFKSLHLAALVRDFAAKLVIRAELIGRLFPDELDLVLDLFVLGSHLGLEGATTKSLLFPLLSDLLLVSVLL